MLSFQIIIPSQQDADALRTNDSIDTFYARLNASSESSFELFYGCPSLLKLNNNNSI